MKKKGNFTEQTKKAKRKVIEGLRGYPKGKTETSSRFLQKSTKILMPFF